LFPRFGLFRLKRGNFFANFTEIFLFFVYFFRRLFPAFLARFLKVIFDKFSSLKL